MCILSPDQPHASGPLNHRLFVRSEHRERVGKSPKELLTGQRHAHWLVLLGYTPFTRN